MAQTAPQKRYLHGTAWERLLNRTLKMAWKKIQNNQGPDPIEPPSVHAEFLAFDPRAFSSLLTRELRIWFHARHHNFVGLTYVFSVEFRFRVDADWCRSCTEIDGLSTHVHSFPLAAFVGCVVVAFLVLLLRFWGFCSFRQLALVQFEQLRKILVWLLRLYSQLLCTALSCLLHWRLRSPCRARLQRKKKCVETEQVC